MEGSLYLSLGAAVPRRQRRSWGFPSRPAAFYLKASWGQPHPHPHPRGWPWVPLAGLPSPAAAPGDKPGPLPPENKRDIQPPPAAARARPPGKLGVESAARDRLQKPPSGRPRRTWYLAAGAKRDAAVSCRPWGARAPASRSAACCCCCCCWPLRRSWPGRRPQRGNARPAFPRTPDPAPRHLGLPRSPELWSCGPPKGYHVARLALPCLASPRVCVRVQATPAPECALFFPALANLRRTQ